MAFILTIDFLQLRKLSNTKHLETRTSIATSKGTEEDNISVQMAKYFSLQLEETH
jgi:hypothetical protein